MIDVAHPLCLDCPKRASFNVEGETSGIYCTKHKKDKMIDVTERRECLECKTRPNFNLDGETIALYCMRHKKENMVDIVNKKCLKCKKQPHFNFEGNKYAIYCSEHKEPNMMDVVNKTCLNENCKTQPVFNFANQNTGLYCSEHKLENMMDVVNRKCLECNVSPCFNFITEKTGIYCATHKKEDMVDVEHKKCLECDKRPSFNYKSETVGIYCFTHKKDSMVDIEHKKCLECDTRPSFNYKGEQTALFCTEHKKNEMVDLNHVQCKTPLCSTSARNPKYKNYCMRCFMYTFPDQPMVKNYKTKEKSMKDFLFTTFPTFTWIWDKTIQDGCSKRRPDFLCDLGTFILIIEIDENQHTDYDSTCEIARINNLVEDLNFRQIILIRFNPDDYINRNGEKMKTPWSTGKNSIVKIAPKNKNQWQQRLETLRQEIDNAIQSTVNDTNIIEIKHLFYDDYL